MIFIFHQKRPEGVHRRVPRRAPLVPAFSSELKRPFYKHREKTIFKKSNPHYTRGNTPKRRVLSHGRPLPRVCTFLKTFLETRVFINRFYTSDCSRATLTFPGGLNVD